MTGNPGRNLERARDRTVNMWNITARSEFGIGFQRCFQSVNPTHPTRLSPRPSLTIRKGPFFIGRLCFEIRHIAFRHRKPQHHLSADFVFGAGQSDVAQLKSFRAELIAMSIGSSAGVALVE